MQPQKIRWHQGHLDVLEKHFPENTTDADPNALLIACGRRRVVQFVRQAIAAQEKRVDAD